MPAKSAIYKHKYGEVEKLTYTNYEKWNGAIQFPLMAIDAWEIVTKEEKAPKKGTSELDYFRKRSVKALGIIFNSCSEDIKQSIRNFRDPVTMWENLRSRYDTGTTSIRRLTLKRKFNQTKPQANESINIFFDTLLGYYDRLRGTPEEISEESMKAHIYTQLPPEFRPTVVVLQHQADVSLEQVMDSLREDEETRESYNVNKEDKNGVKKEEGEALTVRGLQQNTTYRGGNKGRGGHRGHSYNPYISKLSKTSKTTNNPNTTCFACGDTGH